MLKYNMDEQKYERQQVSELKELNIAFWVNTAATVGNFIFSIIMAYLLWGK